MARKWQNVSTLICTALSGVSVIISASEARSSSSTKIVPKSETGHLPPYYICYVGSKPYSWRLVKIKAEVPQPSRK